jgi:F-type H+-transporting ATPase subunit epsilon
MAETTQLELVSPAKLLKSAPAEMVIIPGSQGNFGALPRHAPMIATLRPGVLDIYNGGKVEEQIFIAGGIAEVNPERCTILAEEAMPISDLSADAARERLAAGEKALGEAATELATTQAQTEIDIANAMLQAVGA